MADNALTALLSNPEIVQLLQSLVQSGQSPFSGVSQSRAFGDATRQNVETYGSRQGEDTQLTGRPGYSFLGTSGLLNLQSAIQTYLARQFFTGALTARQVQDAAQQLIQTQPEMFPLQFMHDTLRAINHQPVYDTGQRIPILGDPQPIPEAFPEQGQAQAMHTGRG